MSVMLKVQFFQKKLKIIDAANNKITKLDGLNHLDQLEDIWVCLVFKHLKLHIFVKLSQVIF